MKPIITAVAAVLISSLAGSQVEAAPSGRPAHYALRIFNDSSKPITVKIDELAPRDLSTGRGSTWNLTAGNHALQYAHRSVQFYAGTIALPPPSPTSHWCFRVTDAQPTMPMPDAWCDARM